VIGVRTETALRVSLQVAGGGREQGNQESRLAGFLGSQGQLRGRVHLVDERRQAGGMSQSIATVVVEVGPAALVAFASALISWIRHRTADTRVTVRRQDGAKFEISAQRIRGLGAAELTALAEQIAGVVSDTEPK
jgi:hypothetical protein